MSSVAPAGAVPAVVSGAEALNLRRGPGTESQAFAQLVRGQQVEATKVIGKWTLVRTQGGAEGWVQKQYLTFPGEQPQVEPETTPPATPARTPPANRAEELQQLHDEVSRLTVERDALRGQLAHQPPAAAAAADAPRSESTRMQADIQQLLQLTQELRQMVASQRQPGGSTTQSASAPTTESDSWLMSNGWVLTTSLIVGVLGGMVYGRAQERRRRNRIRF
jgi:SH3 domain protein